MSERWDELDAALTAHSMPNYKRYYNEIEALCGQGDLAACTSQSQLNIRISTVVPDKAIWYDQLKATCTADFARACVSLSYALSADGIEQYSKFDPNWARDVSKEEHTALLVAEKACDLGNPLGCYNAATFYDEGEGTSKNWDVAQRYYARACGAGYFNGCSKISDKTYWKQSDRLPYLREACDIGDVSACYFIAVKNHAPVLGSPSTPEDKERMAQYRKVLKDLCVQGAVMACSDVAALLQGVNALDEAERFAFAACGLQHGEGCTVIGNISKHNRGNEEGLVKSIFYLALGCELENWVGCNDLGHSFEHGLGLEPNKAKAAQLYVLACENELAQGCRNLGKMYEKTSPVLSAIAWQQACELNQAYCSKD